MCQIAIDIPSEPAKSMVSNASWIRKVAIEAVDRKTFVYTATESYESELKLYELEQDLVARDFLRISKQSIVNLRKIKSLKADVNRKIRITLQNGEQIVVSRMYSDELRRKLGLR